MTHLFIKIINVAGANLEKTLNFRMEEVEGMCKRQRMNAMEIIDSWPESARNAALVRNLYRIFCLIILRFLLFKIS